MNSSRKKALIALILITVMATALALSSCSGDPAIGFWIVDKVTAGEVEMNSEDAKSIGLNAVGTVKLQKSGNCVVNLLGEESEGKWQKDADGTITITYGGDQKLTGSIDDEGIMTLTDPQGAEYVLSK